MHHGNFQPESLPVSMPAHPLLQPHFSKLETEAQRANVIKYSGRTGKNTHLEYNAH